MRTSVTVGLLAVCLSLSGCGLFGKRASTESAPSRPFLGLRTSEPQRPEVPVGLAAAPRPPSKALLAGRVLDRFNNRGVARVDIQVRDLEDRAAPVKLTADQDGYFVIPELQAGHHYQLIASVKDGERVLSGVTVTTAPNPRLSIYVSEEYTRPDTPPPSEPPHVPGKKEEASKGAKSDGTPAAALDPPVKTNPESSPVPRSAIPAPAAPPVPDLSRTVRDNDPGTRDGFQHFPQMPANIPGASPPPGSEIPPPPASFVPRDQLPRAPASSPTPPPGSVTPSAGRGPVGQTPVPSCVLVGKQLDNFALRDLNGQPWEYRQFVQQRKPRVVLLDFWYCACPHCLEVMPDLARLQRGYGPFGLQVVGIACEKRGTRAEKVTRVRSVRGRYNINYTTLLSEDDLTPCPVKTQFGVEAFPTLVLLDEGGRIIGRWEGLNENSRYDLEVIIRNRLGIR